VAGVRIDTGPIDHDTPWEKVPPGGRILILGAWRQFFHIAVKYDCRELLRIVEDMETHEVWRAFGYADLEELLRRGLNADPALIRWAVEGLKTLDPSAPIPIKDAVEAGLGTHGGDRRSARAKADQGSIRTLKIKRGTTATYLEARLEKLAREGMPRKGIPPIAEAAELLRRVRAKEMSAHAAAKAVGIVSKLDALDRLRAAWRGTNGEQRAAFIADHADELQRLLDLIPAGTEDTA
jgi:hypothetical protein